VALAAAPSAQLLTSAPPVAPAVARKRAISPRARKFAADFLIDLQAVPGTGPDGRVIEKDVRDYLKTSGYQDRRITPSAFNLARKLGLKLLDIAATGETGRITIADVRRTEAERPKALSKMRQIIARRLQQSKQVIPHFYTTVSVDVTALLAFRKELKAAGHSYSVTDFLLWAIARTLTEFPAVNSHTEDNISSIWNSQVNLGLAVSLENGLVVPVIANADKMGLDELHDVAGELADKARSGKLIPQEMQGGTFTISNMGMLNVENFAAIINPGESAILAVSSAIPCAVVNDRREIVVRDMMKLTLSADHRLVDGAMAAAFLNAVRRCVEDLVRWKAILGV
jgi:pyruvate dehydrogenase E2 component (dihydrolipoamide acetyltransferase)